jgi:MYXO-CTERM domain-containing protein
VPGSYTVGFKIVDTSVNGTGGGPIHSASETFLVNFTAVPEPEEYAAVAAAALVGFALWRRRANRA